MTYQLGKRSIDTLKGVNQNLVSVVELAITLTTQDFTVVEGLRTLARQKELVAKGASKTLNSRHITGHAVDVYPWLNGQVDVNAHEKYFITIAEAMREASLKLKVPLVWGGAWDGALGIYETASEGSKVYIKRKRASGGRPFIDMPHFELSRSVYK
jgi:peptidoglycan L-alanyl-D-glutamate endopeptidase CwlK